MSPRLTAKESVVEKKVSEWARKREVLVWKLNVSGRRGLPDRLFIFPSGRIVFIEFKRQGERPRKMQLYIHQKLRDRNVPIIVGDHYDTIVDELVKFC